MVTEVATEALTDVPEGNSALLPFIKKPNGKQTSPATIERTCLSSPSLYILPPNKGTSWPSTALTLFTITSTTPSWPTIFAFSDRTTWPLATLPAKITVLPLITTLFETRKSSIAPGKVNLELIGLISSN